MNKGPCVIHDNVPSTRMTPTTEDNGCVNQVTRTRPEVPLERPPSSRSKGSVGSMGHGTPRGSEGMVPWVSRVVPGIQVQRR